MGDFAVRMAELSERVGHGTLTGKVTVDQVYAKPIHDGFWETGPLAGVTNQPRGDGEQFFLQRPLFEHYEQYLQRLADGTLEQGGLERTMTENVEDLAEEVATRAPVLHTNLRGSAHPEVTSNGASVYDRPPRVHRLSRSELKESAPGTPRRPYRLRARR